MVEVAIAILVALFLIGIGIAISQVRRSRAERDELLAAGEDLTARARFVEEFSPLPIVMFDGHGLIRRVNPAAQRVFGYTERELFGQTIVRLMPQSPEARKGEVDVRCKNGSSVRVKFDAARSDTPGREIYLFFELPHTANPAPASVHVETADEPHARPSLAAIEGVVNRIVRQFEGLLTTINGYTELALHGAGESSTIRKDLEEIAAASDTASNLSRNLLAFSGNQTIPTELVDLNSLVSAMEPGIRDAVKGAVQIDRASERTSVMGNVDCLRQVVLLLARSAHHRVQTAGSRAAGGASSKKKAKAKGSIRIATERRSIDKPQPVYTGKLPAADYCVLTVWDSGPALKNGSLEHIFEPLFLDAESIGVELAPMYGIVRSLGGWIDVTTGEENGNTFEVFLPWAGDTQVGAGAKGKRALVN